MTIQQINKNMIGEKACNSNVLTFNVNSDGYFKNRPRYPLELYRFIFDNCTEYKLAWDCGCGNGQVSIDLVPKFNKIEASDINENQISNSYKHDKIHYSIQNAEAPNFPDNHFDLVCTAQCLHWFDLDKFFRHAKIMLKPNGVFACWGYGFFHINDNMDESIDKLLLSRIDSFWAPGNRIVQNGYKNIEFPFIKISIPEIKMNIVWNINQLADYLNTWSAVKLYNTKYKADIIDEIKPEITNIMKDTEIVKMDFSYYLGKNNKQ